MHLFTYSIKVIRFFQGYHVKQGESVEVFIPALLMLIAYHVYRVAHLLWERNMLTLNLKLRLAE